eukprot:gene17244-23568_t
MTRSAAADDDMMARLGIESACSSGRARAAARKAPADTAGVETLPHSNMSSSSSSSSSMMDCDDVIDLRHLVTSSSDDDDEPPPTAPAAAPATAATSVAVKREGAAAASPPRPPLVRMTPAEQRMVAESLIPGARPLMPGELPRFFGWPPAAGATPLKPGARLLMPGELPLKPGACFMMPGDIPLTPCEPPRFFGIPAAAAPPSCAMVAKMLKLSCKGRHGQQFINNTEYKVAGIVGVKMVWGNDCVGIIEKHYLYVPMFKVRCSLPYTEADDTWEPVDDLVDVPAFSEFLTTAAWARFAKDNEDAVKRWKLSI